MSWTELILRMFLCLLVAGVIGAVIGWLLHSLFGGNKTAELEASWRGQLAGKEREMETLRADSRKQLATVEGRLADCNTGVKTHLAALADHEAKYATLQASLNARNMEFDKLSADAAALQGKLALADSSSADLHGKLATADASLHSKHSEVGDLTTKLAAAAALAATLRSSGAESEKRKAENDLLRKRIGSLEADVSKASEWEARSVALTSERDGLQKQLGDLQISHQAQADSVAAELAALKTKLGASEAAMTELNGRLATAEAAMDSQHSEVDDLTLKLAAAAALATQFKGRAGETDKLKAENDSLQARLGALQTSNNAQAEDWEMKTLKTSSDKDREIQELQKRVSELEPLGAQAKDWEVKYLAVLDEKQQESLHLRNRVSELEPLGMQLSSIQAEAKSKETQISALEARLKELEAARTKAVIVPDLEAIEGIGPVYFGKLSSQSGIRMQAELLERGKSALGRKEIAEQTGIDAPLILRWVNHCDLRRINGVDEQYAELLEVAGVDTVVELATRNPENLHAKVVAINAEKRVSSRTPSADDIKQWVEQAKTLPRVVTH